MSGKMPATTNQYFSIDKVVTTAEGVVGLPFRCSRLLDIIRNDGPGEAAITLDGGNAIPLDAGDYIGPWADFNCSTIKIQCVTANSSCRVRALGV